ncbi:helix-turn-helix transcriptional regulator [Micromonospora sp. 4G57]|uniref:Helix-turn-helix transcriptional regulator n=1 Tax=Micromonospora sicca TaxID=2202420 RepID=A0ABU5JCK7_9ACTN|nr:MULTISPECIES: helix-turn-helix transcriptional regulator [unclassified Micromonospora]MDZ5441759.1 helix-turn-helix transcriptional regulator [Micromonospora sp. 4G57]MDZ5490320.1 helix-turn-helix transcriptional regulator [Micromonospora sp. 4G53]
METPEDVVRANVRQLREQRRHTVRSLSALLGQLGRPILPSGITKIEDGTRRVDVGDLVALAIALGVNPNRLLLPADDSGEAIALTPAVSAIPRQAWPWARGQQQLLPGEIALGHGERSYAEGLDDFRRHALPASERLRDDHTAARAAQDVLASVRAMLDRAEHPEVYEREDELAARSPRMAAKFGPNPSTPAGLRARLRRLVAEVEALIGDDNGER